MNFLRTLQQSIIIASDRDNTIDIFSTKIKSFIKMTMTKKQKKKKARKLEPRK